MNIKAREKGNIGEEYACRFLENKNCRILCRNYKGKHGEIDIIAEIDSYILFVEVKLRNISGQRPAEAVDKEKINRIIKTAKEFMFEHNDNNYITSMTPRFDVIEIYQKNGDIVRCEHIENILFS